MVLIKCRNKLETKQVVFLATYNSAMERGLQELV